MHVAASLVGSVVPRTRCFLRSRLDVALPDLLNVCLDGSAIATMPKIVAKLEFVSSL
jgi:hypothetical protein